MYTLDGVKDGLYCREIYFIILKLLQRALYSICVYLHEMYILFIIFSPLCKNVSFYVEMAWRVICITTFRTKHIPDIYKELFII